MRAFVLTVGSRGDVQPFVALAARLRANGHDAVLAAPAAFDGLAAAYGVPFAPLGRLLPGGRFLVLRDAPHDWLFPHMQAIVHHGGAGTVAAAVRSGRPQIIWPFGIDQPFWSRRMASLGVAPPARPARALTGASFTAALHRVLGDRPMATRAAELGALVRAEDGVGQAVARLQAVVADTRLTVRR